ncbi:nucleotidyltransferase domain-containing protein [Streptomyces sp. HD]|uniref:nucleotidyltransferase domain-containing protein n=1 Tax=Streptomyces sp. HD TaxID=3020892 RepID=UPI00232EF6F9|nr:amino acid transporter [Streptomyces sp. HD]MDC0765491.1 amino acid transporter [Streptomyces sp. HD]
MTADDVLTVPALLREVRAAVPIGGGWGNDALVGEQNRPRRSRCRMQHGDLDVMHRQEQEAAREIDVHPLVFAEDGSAVQASPEPSRPFKYPSSCFVTGTISGTTVPCLPADQQVYFHQGYEPRVRDRRDMSRLRRAFGIGTHF